jgi:hypothetical protein
MAPLADELGKSREGYQVAEVEVRVAGMDHSLV